MKETKTLMERFNGSGHHVEDCLTRIGHDDDMFECLSKNWGWEDIVIFGQDNVCTEMQLLNMTNCNEEFCAIPCLMYPVSTKLKGIYLNMISDGKMHEIDDRRDWCNGYVGTGLSKISLSLQKRINLDKYYLHYQSMDSTLSRAAKENKCNLFHLHYPLHKHNKI